ncbi:MAG: sigma-70 family RNA polymerase sigma factor [Clostridia bacterium]|nr:sigma-70 family RNA polymerase sigma factor [Clostridia bacterium]
MRIIKEAQCIRALQKGDEAALEEIIRSYTAFVSTIVSNIIGGMVAGDVEEVVSDVFLALWDNADKIRPGKLKPYLGSIARSRAKNKLREKRIDLYIEDDWLPVSRTGPEERIAEAEERDAVGRAVESLAPRDRDVFIRCYYLCQTAREIAEETGQNLFAVQSRLRRARERFKDSLTKGGYFTDDEDNRSP